MAMLIATAAFGIVMLAGVLLGVFFLAFCAWLLFGYLGGDAAGIIAAVVVSLSFLVPLVAGLITGA